MGRFKQLVGLKKDHPCTMQLTVSYSVSYEINDLISKGWPIDRDIDQSSTHDDP